MAIDEQRRKIRDGVAVLKGHGLDVKYFFAPSHTFDENTLTALREESDIRVISDMYTLSPYRKDDFVYIPCQLGHPQKMSIPGTYTICLHPNTMDGGAIERLDSFLRDNINNVIAFNDIDYDKVGEIRLTDRIVRWAYFMMRRLRK